MAAAATTALSNPCTCGVALDDSAFAHAGGSSAGSTCIGSRLHPTAKRRANEKAAELQELQARSESAARSLRFVEDARGLVVAVPVELSETDVLSKYLVPVVEGALPEGLPGALVGRQPFGGFKLSGIGSKAGGPDYLHQFLIPINITENTLRRGFAPTANAKSEASTKSDASGA